jgi:hypothetical protein
MEARLRTACFFGVWQGSSPVMTAGIQRKLFARLQWARAAARMAAATGRGDVMENRVSMVVVPAFLSVRAEVMAAMPRSCPVGVPFLEPCNVIRGAANALFNAIATFWQVQGRPKNSFTSSWREPWFPYLEPNDNRLFCRESLSDDLLCSHRVHRDDGSLRRQCFEKQRNSRDLVAFPINATLADDHFGHVVRHRGQRPQGHPGLYCFRSVAAPRASFCPSSRALEGRSPPRL